MLKTPKEDIYKYIIDTSKHNPTIAEKNILLCYTLEPIMQKALYLQKELNCAGMLTHILINTIKIIITKQKDKQ